MISKKVTESDSLYQDLDFKSTSEILHDINTEDQKVAPIIASILPKIEVVVDSIIEKVKLGGRLFYIGAGTSGRLGVLDASECPPTYGVSKDLVIGIIAGGDKALRESVENAEDHQEQAWKDLSDYKANPKDVVFGVASSGTTPYVLHALKKCKAKGILTIGFSCNKNTPLSRLADHFIEIVLGPEYVTGSTRMKAGTAQKMVLNMISTTLMIKLGRVKGNKMIHMQLKNKKLYDRGRQLLRDTFGINEEEAEGLLKKYGSVAKAINGYKKG